MCVCVDTLHKGDNDDDANNNNRNNMRKINCLLSISLTLPFAAVLTDRYLY
jgi:hypothetical protein